MILLRGCRGNASWDFLTNSSGWMDGICDEDSRYVCMSRCFISHLSPLLAPSLHPFSLPEKIKTSEHILSLSLKRSYLHLHQRQPAKSKSYPTLLLSPIV